MGWAAWEGAAVGTGASPRPGDLGLSAGGCGSVLGILQPYETLGSQIGLRCHPLDTLLGWRCPSTCALLLRMEGTWGGLWRCRVPPSPTFQIPIPTCLHGISSPISHTLQILSAHVPHTCGCLTLRWALAMLTCPQPCCGAEVPPNPPVSIQMLHAEPHAGCAEVGVRWDARTSPP